MTLDAINSRSHKGMFVWNVPSVDPDPVMFVVRMLEAGITDVYIKVADGPKVFTVSKKSSFPAWGENLKQELVDRLHDAGIRVWGWIFLYGNDPKGEGKIAGMQVERFGLDGMIFDQETSADNQVTSDSNGVHTCQQYRNITDKPMILCWWALHKNPSGGQQWHPDSSKTKVTPKQLIAVWEPFVIAFMPMVYWGTDAKKDIEGTIAAVILIQLTVSQYRELTQKPIIPTGRSYTGDGGVAFTSAMILFAEKAMALGCAGLSWWVADQAVRVGMEHIWEAIGDIYADVELFPTLDPSHEPPVVPLEGDEDPSTGSGNETEEEVIDSAWMTVMSNNLKVRMQPVYGHAKNERGRLKKGDEVQVLPGRVESGGHWYRPVVLYVAEEYLK